MKISVSVVIPTIGEKYIFDVIKTLKQSSVKKEIIIVIPKLYSYKIDPLKNEKDVKIVTTSFFSQVKQRIVGFKVARYDLVLQLDSDVLIKENLLQKMCNTLISKGKNSAIAYIPKRTNKKNFKQLIKKFIFYFFIKREKNHNTWDTWFSDEILFDFKNKVKLLPGGCILHYKKNLILENYYSYDGKAYSEDLIHSFLLNKNNINLFVNESLFVEYLNSGHYEFKKFLYFLKYISQEYKVKKELLILSKGNYFYFYFWFAYWFIFQILIFIKNLPNHIKLFK